LQNVQENMDRNDNQCTRWVKEDNENDLTDAEISVLQSLLDTCTTLTARCLQYRPRYVSNGPKCDTRIQNSTTGCLLRSPHRLLQLQKYVYEPLTLELPSVEQHECRQRLQQQLLHESIRIQQEYLYLNRIYVASLTSCSMKAAVKYQNMPHIAVAATSTGTNSSSINDTGSTESRKQISIQLLRQHAIEARDQQATFVLQNYYTTLDICSTKIRSIQEQIRQIQADNQLLYKKHCLNQESVTSLPPTSTMIDAHNPVRDSDDMIVTDQDNHSKIDEVPDMATNSFTSTISAGTTASTRNDDDTNQHNKVDEFQKQTRFRRLKDENVILQCIIIDLIPYIIEDGNHTHQLQRYLK
jgi:hypothetical protein